MVEKEADAGKLPADALDKVLGFGSTDPLAGFASVTANLVVSFYFAKRGFENVARIIRR